MDHPVRVAFCPILFGANGGTFTPKGLPIVEDKDEDGQSIRGKCDRPYDCGTCPYLTRWVEGHIHAGWSVGWECDQCIKKTGREDVETNNVRILPGYYQSGRNPEDLEQFESMPGFDNVDDDNTPLRGCTRCGWQSSFLQLIMRRQGP